MTKADLHVHLQIEWMALSSILCMTHFPRQGSGRAHEYTPEQVALIKRYLNARKEWRAARDALFRDPKKK